MKPRRTRNPAERFWAKVARGGTNACWPWTAYTGTWGYGQFWPLAKRCGGKAKSAHRFALELHLGRPVPKGIDVCHSCDNRACCNPSHLFEGTRKDNMRDCVAKGRIARGARQGNAKLTEAAVRDILASKGMLKDIAARHGISIQHVSRIRAGETWPHVTKGGPK